MRDSGDDKYLDFLIWPSTNKAFSHLTSLSAVHLCSPLCPDFVPDYTAANPSSVVVRKSWNPWSLGFFFLGGG